MRYATPKSWSKPLEAGFPKPVRGVLRDELPRVQIVAPGGALKDELPPGDGTTAFPIEFNGKLTE